MRGDNYRLRSDFPFWTRARGYMGTRCRGYQRNHGDVPRTYRRVYPVTSLLRTSIIFFFSNVISYIHIIKKKEKEGNTDNSA